MWWKNQSTSFIYGLVIIYIFVKGKIVVTLETTIQVNYWINDAY